MESGGILLVIPCFNEAQRLTSNPFAERADMHFLFVDDGSNDGTADLVRSWALPHVEVLSLPCNEGKAEAVRQGMLHALKQERTWLGFWDADLSTPLEEISTMLAWASILNKRVDAVWGSRVLRLGGEIHRHFHRHFMGRCFATIVTFLLGITPYDTQCGAKIFRSPCVDKLFREKFISRWFFDVELVLRAQEENIAIEECPLSLWNDVAGSKLRLFSTSLRGLLDLWRMRRRYR